MACDQHLPPPYNSGCNNNQPFHTVEWTGRRDARQEVYFFSKRHGGIMSKMSTCEWGISHRMYWACHAHEVMFNEIWQRISKLL